MAEERKQIRAVVMDRDGNEYLSVDISGGCDPWWHITKHDPALVRIVDGLYGPVIAEATLPDDAPRGQMFLRTVESAAARETT